MSSDSLTLREGGRSKKICPTLAHWHIVGTPPVLGALFSRPESNSNLELDLVQGTTSSSLAAQEVGTHPFP